MEQCVAVVLCVPSFALLPRVPGGRDSSSTHHRECALHRGVQVLTYQGITAGVVGAALQPVPPTRVHAPGIRQEWQGSHGCAQGCNRLVHAHAA